MVYIRGPMIPAGVSDQPRDLLLLKGWQMCIWTWRVSCVYAFTSELQSSSVKKGERNSAVYVYVLWVRYIGAVESSSVSMFMFNAYHVCSCCWRQRCVCGHLWTWYHYCPLCVCCVWDMRSYSLLVHPANWKTAATFLSLGRDIRSLGASGWGPVFGQE